MSLLLTRSRCSNVFNVTNNVFTNNVVRTAALNIQTPPSSVALVWRNSITSTAMTAGGAGASAVLIATSAVMSVQLNLFSNSHLPFELKYLTSAQLLPATNNWWGTATASAVVARVRSFANDGTLDRKSTRLNSSHT